MPTQWASAVRDHAVPIPGAMWFATEGVDDIGNTAYGTYHTSEGYGVGSVDLGKGGLHRISTVTPSNWAGVLWMSVSNPWVVWAESVPKLPGAWDLKAWNIQSGTLLNLASSRLLAGQYTFPVVNHTYVAWSQATSNTSAEIRVYDFARASTTVLDSGRVSPPVLAGNYLVWAKGEESPANATFRMVDAVSLAPVAVPAALAEPTPIVYLAGSAPYLLWTQSGTGMAAYDFQTGSLTTYQMAHRDGRHFFQFPMLAGRMLMWWSGIVSTVVDLDTGNGFEVTNGVAAGSGDLVVVSGAQASTPTLAGLNLTSGLAIPTC